MTWKARFTLIGFVVADVDAGMRCYGSLKRIETFLIWFLELTSYTLGLLNAWSRTSSSDYGDLSGIRENFYLKFIYHLGYLLLTSKRHHETHEEFNLTLSC